MRRIVFWLLLAASLALVSIAVDRTTPIEVFSDGGNIRVKVADTVLSAPQAIRGLKAVEILAMDSIDPPGGQWIAITVDSGEVFRDRLPSSFDIPPGEIVPLGDWELDERAGWGTVWRREIEHRGPFILEASFRGRFLHDLTVVLHGDPTTSISIRRGLINDDAFIRDAAGFDLASTTIDPTPLADLGAITATLSRSAAVACLLITVFTGLQTRTRPRPLPAASRAGPTALLVVVLAAAATALSGWFAKDVLEGLPHTPDGVVYLMQADWLLDGSLWSSVNRLQEYLTVPFTYADGERWLAHYPPGWPGLLAIGVAAHLPWLVAPLLGGVYVLLLFFAGRELGGPTLGLVAATLGVISPLTRVIFGSMLSHALAATLILAALLLALRARHSSRWLTAAAAGGALGLAFGVRPLTAVAVAVPLCAMTALRPFTSTGSTQTRIRVVAFVGAFAVAALPTLAANTLITGSALSFPYSLAHGSMFGAANIPFGLRNLDAILASSAAGSTGWGWNLLHGPWMYALSCAPAFVALLTKKARTADWMLAATVASVMVAYLGTRGHGLHGFGPRYHFEVLAPFFLLTARGFFVLAGLGGEAQRDEKRIPVIAAFGLFFALCLPAGAILPSRLALYRGYNGVDGSLERQVAALAPERALIVLPTEEWQGWASASRVAGLRPDAPILVIQADADDPALPILAGDRPVFFWRDGRLSPR